MIAIIDYKECYKFKETICKLTLSCALSTSNSARAKEKECELNE